MGPSLTRSARSVAVQTPTALPLCPRGGLPRLQPDTQALAAGEVNEVPGETGSQYILPGTRYGRKTHTGIQLKV